MGLAAPEPGPRIAGALRPPCVRGRAQTRASAPTGCWRSRTPTAQRRCRASSTCWPSADGWGGGEGERPYLGRAFSVCRFARHAGSSSWSSASGPAPTGWRGSRPARRSGSSDRSGSGSPSRRRGCRDTGALLVGGGIGVAPLVIWAEALIASGAQPRTLLGLSLARTRERGAAARRRRADRDRRRLAGTPRFRDRVARAELEHGRHSRRLRVRAADDARGRPAICARARGAGRARDGGGDGVRLRRLLRLRGANDDGYRRICVDGPVIDAGDLDEKWLER